MKQGNKEYSPWLGVVAHACNSNPQEAETEGSRVQDQPGLRSDNLLKKKPKLCLKFLESLLIIIVLKLDVFVKMGISGQRAPEHPQDYNLVHYPLLHDKLP
jgi:hypothetical protein